MVTFTIRSEKRVRLSVPTVYRGTRFRSRLEADWAREFDALGMEWRYEPKLFNFHNGAAYLPDFYLPGQRIFVECRAPDRPSMRKPAMLLKTSRRPVLLAAPDGHFALFSPEQHFIEMLFESCWSSFEYVMENYSSLAVPASDALDFGRNYFWNGGLDSDAYVGRAPDYWDSIKDRSRADGGDARTEYWGGMSTSSGRGYISPMTQNP